jgi:hypothetical protein
MNHYALINAIAAANFNRYIGRIDRFEGQVDNLG